MEQTGNSESCVAVWVAVAVCIRCVLQIYVAVCVADICCSVCCSVCFFAKLATASRVGLESEGKNIYFLGQEWAQAQLLNTNLRRQTR